MKCIDLDISGFMSHEELAWLHYRALLSASVVEVGSWMGRSTYALLTACAGRVWAVDHFLGSPSELETNHREAKTDNIYGAFQRNVGYFTNLTVLREDSVTASERFADATVEMVFIDGEHTEESALADIRAWQPKCSRLFAGHDRDISGVAAALESAGLKWSEGPGSIWYVEEKR